MITTLAGGGTRQPVNGLQGTSAALGRLTGVAADSAGNVYVAGGSPGGTIIKVDTAGILTIVAGGGSAFPNTTTGIPATSAQIGAFAVAVDSAGNLYIVDQALSRVYKVTAAGSVTRIAGFGAGFSGDGGPATGASLNSSSAVAVDRTGNVYIADSINHRIRKIDAAGIITTIAGISTRGFSGDGGPATSAQLNDPEGVAVDSAGNVYISDYENNRIRRVDRAGIITTVAGTGVYGFSGDGGPATRAQLAIPQGIAVDTANNLYIADTSNSRIRKVDTAGIITTVAGVGFNLGDGGPATSANIGAPFAVAVDGGGNFYTVSPLDGRVRKITIAPAPPAGPNGKGLGAAGGCHCGDPINISSGNLYEQVADYQTAGPNQLGLTRYYNSMANPNTLATRLGSNWRSTYDRYIRIVSSSSVIAERPDGQEFTFTLTSGAWTADTDVDLKLTNSGTTTWTLIDTTDTVETYRTGVGGALLQSVKARNGYTQTLQYDASNQLTGVTDSFQRTLSFTYENGLLQTFATPDGLVLTYGYTAAGSSSLLTSVSYSTSPVTSQTYLYESAGFPAALTGIVDENGNRYTAWTYDSSGRALTSQHAGGADLTSVAYNDADGSRTVTYPLGAQLVYHFTNLQGLSKVTQIDRLPTGTIAAASMKFTYDGNGYTASQTDWNGNLTTFVNDAHGQRTTMVEASGTPQARTTTTTYHATLRLPIKVVEPGITTTYTYDTAGNLLTKTATDTTTTTVPYSTSGTTRTWTYTWSNFLPASTRTPRTDVAAVTRFTYDSSGALTATTNALGHTTRITEHLPAGSPLTVVDPRGVTTQLTYDARLRLSTSTVNAAAGPLTTTYNYDPAGNLLSYTGPDGSAITYTYDAAHRLAGAADRFNQSIAYTLNALGGRTQIDVQDSIGARQRTHAQSFDSLGRLLRDTGGAGQVTNYAYDSNGNKLTLTDPLGRLTANVFDPLNRLAKTTDPAKGVTATSYDPLNRPTNVIDPNGGATAYIYDGFGDVIQRVSPDSGTTVYRYDLDGNLTQRLDGAGAIVNYTYDALGRVLTAAYPGHTAENVTYTYDQPTAVFGVGRLTAVTDAAGRLNRTYDERGNVLSETRTNGAVTLATSYTYDAADRISSITYPSGWTVAYSRDAMGRATVVTVQAAGGGATVPVLASAGYQPLGPINALTFGNGVTETRSFDLDYRLTGLADTGTATLQSLAYAYDAANNVSSITDGVAAANSQSFGYDSLNRLIRAAGGYGSFAYSYDSVGNRMTKSADGAGAAEAYTYTAKSNQLSAVTAGGVKQAIGYDKAGNVNSLNPAARGVTSAIYNQAGRLAAAMAGSNPVAQYTYDAFGQRLLKAGAVSGTTLYQYDQNGHLLEESDGQGDPLVDYIYLGDLPVATLSPSDGQVYYLHDDRLGTPQWATDSSQNVVWTASYGPFGEMSTIPALIVQNLRLPGQEFDVDTGLYHNGFRDYAPGWGRYLQSDPIGLAGGLNTYGYVGANPVNLTDPRGLADTTGGTYTSTIQTEEGEEQCSIPLWVVALDSQACVIMDPFGSPDQLAIFLCQREKREQEVQLYCEKKPKKCDEQGPFGKNNPNTPFGANNPKTPFGPNNPNTPFAPNNTPFGPNNPNTPFGPNNPNTPFGPNNPNTPFNPNNPVKAGS